MSIIIGIVTNKCALVASDGWLHSGACFNYNRRIKDSEIIQEDFDKTFALDNGNIIGAVAGIMLFENKIIADHLQEILNTIRQKP